MTAAELKDFQQKIKAAVNDATEFAEKAALPDPETLGRFVYAD
jgi:2-oxoisovalerate dehydrogenase E1 component alpha subunit